MIAYRNSMVSDGIIPGTYYVGFNLMRMVFDVAHIWVADYDSGTVTKLSIN